MVEQQTEEFLKYFSKILLDNLSPEQLIKVIGQIQKAGQNGQGLAEFDYRKEQSEEYHIFMQTYLKFENLFSKSKKLEPVIELR